MFKKLFVINFKFCTFVLTIHVKMFYNIFPLRFFFKMKISYEISVALKNTLSKDPKLLYLIKFYY